ncbi:hypothetical protein HPB50_009088 [Hyalomma asiaticum]|uniref:Uncharacterized protein n=1 Tax=Hyalomma asiaticum TaxID=266040 RepID=A0ACB7THF7_HYAAI|nr:hypothetical protein HPB50_009088 [Hyalomma asiaticum]
MGTTSNPFLFFMQFALIASTTGASTTEASTANTESTPIPRANQHGDCAEQVLNLGDDWGHPCATSSITSTQAIKALLPSDFFSGHVGWRPVGMSNPFLCFMQVSNDVSTIKTKHPCCVQLPCSRRLIEIYIIARDFVLSLLMLCGDIESSPGPAAQQLLNELLVG